jgi:hypothetical protein
MALDLSKQTPEQIRLLSKLGSIAVHAEEMLSPNGVQEDVIAMRSLLEDPDVKEFLHEMGPLVPQLRSK